MITDLSELISQGLNRLVNDEFSRTLVRLFHDNNNEARFVATARALGLGEPLAKTVHSFINDHINALLREAKQDKKKKRVVVSFDEDDVLDLPQPTAPKSFKFKKIKKLDAQRIREEKQIVPKQEAALPKEEATATMKKEGLSLLELAALEKLTAPEEMHADDEFHLSDAEIDREWYMNDEIEPPAPEDYEAHVPKQVRRPTGNGGRFDSNGVYHDFDHEADAGPKVKIVTHFVVPPFLDPFAEYLTVQLGKSAQEVVAGFRPAVSVVKDPLSELAVIAKQGSPAVKDVKAKRERAQQARDRSTLEGTKMGLVLGVKEETQKSQTTAKTTEKVDFQAIQAVRRQLPAFAVREGLMRAISENQVTIVIGETGSGKTTQLAQYLYEDGMCAEGLMIGCTQPRRVAAMSVAKRVSEEMGVQLSKEVGYSIRFEDKTSPQTRIKYMTYGILLREIMMDPTLEKYLCVIMDEAHERSLNTDVLLGLFKKLLTRRRDLKVIVTSATMNADRFSAFFGGAPQFTIPGRTFPVEVFFSRLPAEDYVETAVRQVLTVHLKQFSATKNNDGDILVFMTGQDDIEVTCAMIQEKLDMLEDAPPLDVYPIYSTLPADLQAKIFNRKDPFRRKVVVATNIAETSLTVDGIKYVVDTGLVKMKTYNARLGMEALQVVPISLANANQRSGRAGRTGPGVAYRLYTEKAASPQEMHSQPVPEIQRTNLANVMLLLKSMNVKDIHSFPFLDPPPRELVATSLYDLWSFGALDNLGNLTTLGRNMAQFPMEPVLSKLILLACQPQFHCSHEVVTIVSMLSIPSVFFRPKERADEADSAREKFTVAESDHLTLLNVYLQFEQQLRKKPSYQGLLVWAARNFLQLKSLLRAKDIRSQIVVILQKNRLPLVKARNDNDIRRCICAAFFHQLARVVKVGILAHQSEYSSLRHPYMHMHIHPTSGLVGGASMAPEYVVYHELILTSKEFMSCITAVDPVWLVEFGYVFYGAKEPVGVDVLDKDALQRQIDLDRQAMEQTTVKPKKVAAGAKFRRRAL